MAGGSNEWLSSRFARLRVHVASGHERPGEPTKEWLLIEWPEGEKEPTRYWLSDLAEQHRIFRDLVDAAKLTLAHRARYQELKQEVGLGHYEGRGWRGFHHSRHDVHRSLRIPDLRKGDDSPLRPRPTARLPQLAVPDSYRPEDPPLAPERHVPKLDRPPCARRIIDALVRRLPRLSMLSRLSRATARV